MSFLSRGEWRDGDRPQEVVASDIQRFDAVGQRTYRQAGSARRENVPVE